jgi:hypothetical protein
MNDVLSDDEYSRLLQLGSENDSLEQKMKQQLAVAQQLRATANQQGFPTRSSAIMNGITSLAGGAMQGMAMKNGAQLPVNRAQQQALMLKGLLGARPQQPMQGQQPLAVPPQMPQNNDWQAQYPEL